jgi:hypothetical protein
VLVKKLVKKPVKKLVKKRDGPSADLCEANPFADRACFDFLSGSDSVTPPFFARQTRLDPAERNWRIPARFLAEFRGCLVTIASLLRRIAFPGALLLAASAGLPRAACYASPVGVVQPDNAQNNSAQNNHLGEPAAIRTDCASGGDAHAAASTGGDRSTVVGVFAMRDCFTNTLSMRWTEADGVVAISDSPDHTATNASTGSAADGSLLLGYSSTETGIQAYLYDRKHGVRSLREVLAARYDMGLDLSSATFDSLAAQPDRAPTSVRQHTHAGAGARAGAQVLGAPVPEPSTIALLAAAALTAASAKVFRRCK